MIKHPVTANSMVACIDKADGAIFRLGAATRMVGPTLVELSHVLLGAGCDDWGMCVYLTLTDARRLSTELSRLLSTVEDTKLG
jgi:hypothetical protein